MDILESSLANMKTGSQMAMLNSSMNMEVSTKARQAMKLSMAGVDIPMGTVIVT